MKLFFTRVFHRLLLFYALFAHVPSGSTRCLALPVATLTNALPVLDNGASGHGGTIISMDGVHEACDVVGSCIPCSDSEMERAYCSSGEKARVVCIRNGVEHEYYQSCQLDGAAGLFSVIVFMAVCAFLGSGAYLVVLARRRQSLSLFDRRRQRPQSRARGR